MQCITFAKLYNDTVMMFIIHANLHWFDVQLANDSHPEDTVVN